MAAVSLNDVMCCQFSFTHGTPATLTFLGILQCTCISPSHSTATLANPPVVRSSSELHICHCFSSFWAFPITFKWAIPNHPIQSSSFTLLVVIVFPSLAQLTWPSVTNGNHFMDEFIDHLNPALEGKFLMAEISSFILFPATSMAYNQCSRLFCVINKPYSRSHWSCETPNGV